MAGQHRAKHGESSWHQAEARTGEQTLALPAGPAWTGRRAPRPRPRRSWSAQDFAAWSVFCHPDVGDGVCGCHTPGCTVRAHLDLIDWGPAGPPLPAVTH